MEKDMPYIQCKMGVSHHNRENGALPLRFQCQPDLKRGCIEEKYNDLVQDCEQTSPITEECVTERRYVIVKQEPVDIEVLGMQDAHAFSENVPTEGPDQVEKLCISERLTLKRASSRPTPTIAVKKSKISNRNVSKSITEVANTERCMEKSLNIKEPDTSTPHEVPRRVSDMESETTESGSEADGDEDGDSSRQGENKLTCIGCDRVIFGGYYACLQCAAGAPLCARCEAPAHARHYTLRVPARARPRCARALLTRVRAILAQGFSECRVKTEIKEEPLDPEQSSSEPDLPAGRGGHVARKATPCDISRTMVEIEVENIGVPANEPMSDERVEPFAGLAGGGGARAPAAACDRASVTTTNIERVQSKSVYKCCFVPACKNTTETAPDKMFLSVPRGTKIRQLWCEAIGRDDVSPTSCLHCCEDHFNVEEDLDNYMRYKIMVLQQGKRNLPLRLKKGVVPHKFQRSTEQPPQPGRNTY